MLTPDSRQHRCPLMSLLLSMVRESRLYPGHLVCLLGDSESHWSLLPGRQPQAELCGSNYNLTFRAFMVIFWSVWFVRYYWGFAKVRQVYLGGRQKDLPVVA